MKWLSYGCHTSKNEGGSTKTHPQRWQGNHRVKVKVVGSGLGVYGYDFRARVRGLRLGV